MPQKSLFDLDCMKHFRNCNATMASSSGGAARPHCRAHSLPFGTIKGTAGAGHTLPPPGSVPHPGSAASVSLAPTQSPAHPILSLLLVFLAPAPASPFGFQCPPPSRGSKFRHGSQLCPRHSLWHRPQAPHPRDWGTEFSASQPSPRASAQPARPIQTGARQWVSKLLPVMGLLQRGAAGLQLQ